MSMDPYYYGLGGSRWNTSYGKAKKIGDPYYYGIGAAPEIPDQPEFLRANYQPTVSYDQPGIVRLGEIVEDPADTGQVVTRPVKALGQANPQVFSADYQGRSRPGQMFGSHSGLQGSTLGYGLGEGQVMQCMVMCGIVAAGVSYIVSKYT